MPRDEIKVQFGKQLKKAREDEGTTQTELSGMIGKYSERISLFERGMKFPSKQEFENLCNLLNKTPEYFFPKGVPELPEERSYTVPSNKKRNNKFGGHGFDNHASTETQNDIAEYTNIIPMDRDPKTGLIMNTNKKIDEIAVDEETHNNKIIPVVEETIDVIGVNNTKRKVSISVPTSGGASITITIEEENIRPQYSKPPYKDRR